MKPTEHGPETNETLASPVANARTHFSLDRPTWRLILALALPALAQQYLLLLVRLSDNYLAGNLEIPDPDELKHYQSAMTTAGYLYWFVSSYTILVSVGSTALVARFTGAGDGSGANRAVGQSVILGIAFGLAGSIAALLGLSTLVSSLQLTGEAAHYCTQFLTPLAAMLMFQVTESACVACLAGAGDTRTGLHVLGGVAVLNVPLAWTLCFGIGSWHGLGFVGISIGTGLSHMIGCATVLAILARGRSGLKLHLANLKPDGRLIYRLLRVSVPAGIDSLSVGVCQLWFLALVNQLGDVPAAAHGVALQWEALGYLAGSAFGTAAMALVGQNLGAGRPDRAAKAGSTAFVLGCGLMIFMGVLFVILAEPMFRVFCPKPSQTPIVEEGVRVLRLVAFAMPALASSIVFTSALRGAGDTRVPVLFTWVGFLAVRIPLTYVLTRREIDLGSLGVVPGYDLGLYGAWIAMFADIWVRGIFFAARFMGGRWKRVEV